MASFADAAQPGDETGDDSHTPPIASSPDRPRELRLEIPRELRLEIPSSRTTIQLEAPARASSGWLPQHQPWALAEEDWGRHSDNGQDSPYGQPLVKMSTWSGQPSIKGSSETVRMMLLTCISVGITLVPPPEGHHFSC